MGRLRWLLASAVLLVLGVVALPHLLATDTVRTHAIAQIESATGLTVRLDGAVRFTLWPFLDLMAEDVAVTQGEALALEADSVRIGLAIMPLLSGTVRVTELSANAPVIRLATGPDSAGQPDDQSFALPASAAFANLSVERLAISDGTLILEPEDGGPATRLDGIEAEIALPGIDRAMQVALRARHEGQILELSGGLDTPARLLDGEMAQVNARLEAAALIADPVELDATAHYADGRLRFDGLTVAGGEFRLSGWTEAVFLGSVPYVEAQLSGTRLDIDALLGEGAGQTDDAATPAPIDFSILESFAADIDLSLDVLAAAGLETGRVALRAAVESGQLWLTAEETAVAGGSVSGRLQVDPGGARPTIRGALNASGVDLAALAGPLPLPYGLSGRLGADLRVATAGTDPAALRRNVNAAGEITLRGGAATGLGLAEALGDPAADRVDDLSVTLTMTDIAEPVRLNGAAAWRGERVDLSAEGGLAGLLAGAAAAVSAQLATGRFKAGYQGDLAADGALDGEVSVETDSLRGLLAWLGRDVAVPNGLERFALAGRLDLSPDAAAFREARLTLDGTSGEGSGRVRFGARPHIEAQLALDRLDLDPYLGDGGAGAPAPAGDWSDAAIDLSGLHAFDAALALEVGMLVYDGIETTDTALSVEVAEGRMNAELRQLALYGGSGSGTLTVDASGAEPSLAARFSLKDLDAYPFLLAAADFRRIAGLADIELDLATSGASQRALVSRLAGTAGFEFRDGAIRGIDVQRMARALSDGILSGWQASEADSTAFHKLSARFEVADGIARNDDLQLVGPLVVASGAGQVDMPQRALDYRVEPRVEVAPGEGQVGFGVPVVISGSWGSPRIYPDIGDILENPEAAYTQLRALGGGIFSGLPDSSEGLSEEVRERTGIDLEAVTRDGRIDRDAATGEAVRQIGRFLGGDQEDGEADGADGAEQPARDRVRGLLDRLSR